MATYSFNPNSSRNSYLREISPKKFPFMKLPVSKIPSPLRISPHNSFNLFSFIQT